MAFMRKKLYLFRKKFLLKVIELKNIMNFMV